MQTRARTAAAVVVAVILAGLAWWMMTPTVDTTTTPTATVSRQPSAADRPAPVGREATPPRGAVGSPTQGAPDTPTATVARTRVEWEDLPIQRRQAMEAVQALSARAVLTGCLIGLHPSGGELAVTLQTVTGPEGLLDLDLKANTAIPDSARDCVRQGLWRAPWLPLDVDGELHSTEEMVFSDADYMPATDSPERAMERGLKAAQLLADRFEGRPNPLDRRVDPGPIDTDANPFEP